MKFAVILTACVVAVPTRQTLTENDNSKNQQSTDIGTDLSSPGSTGMESISAESNSLKAIGTDLASPRIKLVSSDGKEFMVSTEIARQSNVIMEMADRDEEDIVIPLPKVTGTILAKGFLFLFNLFNLLMLCLFLLF